jgi:ATP-dependent DNA ligase
MKKPLLERRALLRSVIVPNDHVTISEVSASAQQIAEFVKAHKLEGIVAKKADSKNEPGKRSGAWVKTRIHMAQEFVIGGYTSSHLGVDALIIGFYRGKNLLYAGRVRAGFTPRTRRIVYEQIKHLENKDCPFTNLPQASAGRWSIG